MHTRLAQPGDVEHLVVLGKMLLTLHQTFDQSYYQLDEQFDEKFGNFLAQHINHPHQFIIVALDDTRIIGFISGFVKALYPWFSVKSVGHLSYLVTKPEVRRTGVGKALEKAAIAWFKEKNVNYVEVYTDEKNSVGTIVWDKLGYTPFKKFLRKSI